jgi:hypothetical protein
MTPPLSACVVWHRLRNFQTTIKLIGAHFMHRHEAPITYHNTYTSTVQAVITEGTVTINVKHLPNMCFSIKCRTGGRWSGILLGGSELIIIIVYNTNSFLLSFFPFNFVFMLTQTKFRYRYILLSFFLFLAWKDLFLFFSKWNII